MKIYLKIFLLILLAGCKPNNQSIKEEAHNYSFFVGTNTGGESEGIYKCMLNKNGKLSFSGLVAKTENPTFLALSADEKYLLAVNEISNEKEEGTVESYLIKDDKLDFLSRQSSGGASPCYISVNPSGYVLTANYTGGNIGLLKFNESGILSELLDLEQHSGEGTSDRQKGPHAHTARFHPGNNHIISADLGTNELWFSVLDTIKNKLIPSYPQKIKMNPGAGPRHIAFHPNGQIIYVINELDCTVSLLHKDDKGIYKMLSSVSTLPPGFTGESYCADIHISSDGKFLYASNRGHNSIAVFKIFPESGKLKPLVYEPTKGDWPRNFCLSPDENFLIVANKKSGNIVSFIRDKETGLLKYTDEVKAPDPVCILFTSK